MSDMHIPLGPRKPIESRPLRDAISGATGRNEVVQQLLLNQEDEILRVIDDALSVKGEGIMYLLDLEAGEVTTVINAAVQYLQNQTREYRKEILTAAGVK